MSQRSILNYIGIAILILGMGTGEFLYWRSLKTAEAAADGESPYDSRVYQQDVERTIGVFGLIMAEISQSLVKLGEPGPMGIAIGVVSIAAAGGCFFVASRLPPE
jgi:hypothetical protein